MAFRRQPVLLLLALLAAISSSGATRGLLQTNPLQDLQNLQNLFQQLQGSSANNAPAGLSGLPGLQDIPSPGTAWGNFAKDMYYGMTSKEQMGADGSGDMAGVPASTRQSSSDSGGGGSNTLKFNFEPELTLNPKLGLKALDLAPTLTVSTTPLDLKVQAGVTGTGQFNPQGQLSGAGTIQAPTATTTITTGPSAAINYVGGTNAVTYPAPAVSKSSGPANDGAKTSSTGSPAEGLKAAFASLG